MFIHRDIALERLSTYIIGSMKRDHFNKNNLNTKSVKYYTPRRNKFAHFLKSFVAVEHAP